MTDHAAFLAKIISVPEDDLPRLIYADYLDERGEPERAEFIHVQCELAVCPVSCVKVPCNPPCVRCALRRRERELIGWQAYMPLAVTNDVCFTPENPDDVKWHRGFVEEITCSWADWRTHADAIRASTPLRKIKFTTTPDVTLDFLAGTYPGIEFELPPRLEDYIDRHVEISQDELVRNLRRAAGSMVWHPIVATQP